METRAPYVLIGSFVLAAILAVFGFVYWLNNTGGIGPRTNYHVQFQGPVLAFWSAPACCSTAFVSER